MKQTFTTDGFGAIPPLHVVRAVQPAARQLGLRFAVRGVQGCGKIRFGVSGEARAVARFAIFVDSFRTVALISSEPSSAFLPPVAPFQLPLPM